MVVLVLNLLRIRWIYGSRLIVCMVRFIEIVWSFFKTTKLTIPNTFITANTIKRAKKIKGLSEEITIVCVVTNKDFLTLPGVLRSAVKAVGLSNLISIQIIVPERHRSGALSLLNSSLPVQIEIKTDEELISSEQIKSIKYHFGDKASWITQQLLKFETVRSISSNCLILDADTLILNGQYLEVIDGVQPLTPTEEFHKPYYDFLIKISPFFVNTTNSFVPHHQIIQKDIFEEMCFFLEIDHLQNLINLCITNADTKEVSSLCIDYELYAQYLFRKYPDRYTLTKWSNISIPNYKYRFYSENKFVLVFLSKLYNSISFHSWS